MNYKPHRRPGNPPGTRRDRKNQVISDKMLEEVFKIEKEGTRLAGIGQAAKAQKSPPQLNEETFLAVGVQQFLPIHSPKYSFDLPIVTRLVWI